MADLELYNIDTDAGQIYQQYSPPPPQTFEQPIIEGGAFPVTTINGNAGAGASGPTISLSGGSTGYDFDASGSAVTLQVDNAVTARTAIGAAQSGVNTDITELNGASQVDVSSRYEVSGTKVVGAQQAAIPDASGGLTIDTEARAALNTLLAALRTHGLIDT